ncbi:hypothetical protein SSTU70S_07112 [Stutzerimonas stutzeri]
MVALVLPQTQLGDLDLCAERKTCQVVDQVVIGHAQTVFGKGPLIAAADAELQGARFMAVFRQHRALDVQARRRVAIDRLQQTITVRGIRRIALLTSHPVAHQTIGTVLNQCPSLARQRLEIVAFELLGIVGQLAYPAQLLALERCGTGQQFTLARRPIVDVGDQPGIDYRTHGIGRNRGQRELFSQFQAGPGDLQQLKQTVGTVLVEEEIVEADLLELRTCSSIRPVSSGVRFSRYSHRSRFSRRLYSPIFSR